MGGVLLWTEVTGVKSIRIHHPTWWIPQTWTRLSCKTGRRRHRSLRSSQTNGAAAAGGRRPRLLRKSRRRRPPLPLTTSSRAAGITDLKALGHGKSPPPLPPPPARPSSLGSPPLFMPIKQPIGPILHGGQCTVATQAACGGTHG